MKNQNVLKLALSFTLLMLITSYSEVKAQSNVKFTEPKKQTQDAVVVQEEKPYTYVEQMPEYEGGEAAFMQFMAKNMKHQATGAEGTSFVSFIIEKDGSLSNIEVVKSANAALDKEIVRVLKLTSGKWKPGKQNGRTVKVKMVQPVKFAGSK